MQTVRDNSGYIITTKGVVMVENALDNPSLVQISVTSGCTITLPPMEQYGISLVDDMDPYWNLTGINTKLNRAEEHFIYARLDRNDREALLVFSVNDYKIDGSITEEGEDGSSTQIKEPSDAYYYIKIGKITATDSVENASVDREITFDFGYYKTDRWSREDSQWLPKEVWDRNVEEKVDESGTEYLFIRKPIVVDGGAIFYAGTQIGVDSIFKGLPLDTTTLQWVDGKLTVVGGTGGGTGDLDEEKLWNLLGNSGTQQINPTHMSDALKNYLKKEELSEATKNFVTIDTDQSISGMKDFTNGMKVSGTLFKVINGVLTLDCSLAVTGGITTYAIGEQTASTIMDGIVCDETTITKSGGKLTVIGGTGGASNWDELEGKPSWITDTKPTYAWGEIAQKPTTLSGYGIQASDVLNALKTVDGSGSGLDADTLDNYHATGLLTSMSSSRATNLSVTVGGTTKTISSLHADYAYSLYNSVQLWGNTFNGTQNLSGTISISGTSQLLFSSYGGGFYMTDSDWVRVYGNKKFHCGNNVQVDGNINAGRIITGNKFVASGLYTTALKAANVFISGNAIYDTSDSDVVVAGGNCRPIIRWGERNSNGWRTRYLISSAREDNNSWGRLFIAVSNSDAGTSLGCSFSLYGAGYAKIEGNLLVTGGGTFYSSDIRAKTIIERPKLSLNSIANAPVIKFRWNGYNGLKDDNKLHVGGIAQYIEKILPECVIGQKGDFLSFDYATTGYIFSVLTARHLLSYETRTDRIIRKLKERIKRLERQLNIENHEEVCIVAD